jgi:hypothetical protein
MNLTSAEREGGAVGTAGSLGLAVVPKLVPGRYAEWRPQMETALMRAGIAARDYRVENPDWAELTAAVDEWTQSDERASINFALGRGAGSSSSKGAGPTSAEKEMRRGATEAVARTKRAYALLHQALPEDLRRLVEQVPQGYAYGIWSWLEKRFQSTDQDNVGDLWEEFTSLSMEEDEFFDVYKARVDRVFGLLAHAKDKPSPGLYAHRLLWKLTPIYRPAVLALKASGKLKDAAKIEWDEIVAFIDNHERSERRLTMTEERTFGLAAAAAAAAAARENRHGQGERRRRDDVKCFNCGEHGHFARSCRQPRKAREREEQDDSTEEEEHEYHSKERKQAPRTERRGEKAAAAVASRRLQPPGRLQMEALTSDSEEDGFERNFGALVTRA